MPALGTSPLLQINAQIGPELDSVPGESLNENLQYDLEAVYVLETGMRRLNQQERRQIAAQ